MNFRRSFLLFYGIFIHIHFNVYLVQLAPSLVRQNTSKRTDGLMALQTTQFKRLIRSDPIFAGYGSLLEKIQKGREITMIALGGSNTAGGGLSMTDKRYFELVSDWWNSGVYNSTKSRMNAYSMAITGTGSDFFGFCFQNFLEKKTNPDIVLLEFAINDSGDDHGKAAQPMEVLTRRLLLLPTKPLVIYINLVNPDMVTGRVTNRKCSNMQDMGFDELAKHYGIPSFSMRDIVCPLTNGKRVLDESMGHMFANDGSHTSSLGHSKISSMIIKYLEKVVVKGNVPGNLETVPLTIPKPLFSDQSIDDNQLNKPLCWSHMTSNWKIPLKQTLNVQVVKSSGLKYRSPKEARWVNTIRTDAPSGWETTKPGPIAFAGKFTIPPDAASRSLSVVFQIRHEKPMSIKIYLNDEQKSCILMVVKKSSSSTVTQTRVFSVAKEISPGTYDVNIEGEAKWIDMVGIVAGYPGYHGYKGYKTFEGTITKC